MKTYSVKKSDINKKWILIDAKDAVLGRLAVISANILRGKNKPEYTPNQDCGDNLIIINSDQVQLKGKKADNKIYYRHTGYPGGLKETSYKDILNSSNPEKLIKLSVKRMLPKGILGREQFKKLHVYSKDKHPHSAQKPENIDFKSLNKKNVVRWNYASK